MYRHIGIGIAISCTKVSVFVYNYIIFHIDHLGIGNKWWACLGV